jgi:CubicO group peptidase (beta-lactamase class C family)
MKMRERGIINLDTPLIRYTPERFLVGDSRLDLITARHVLSHTSGFPDIRSREHPLSIQFRPGEKWQDSGEGYAYLQSVTTRLIGHQLTSPCGSYETDLRVCGTDFDSYMKSNVLQPLGMTSSGYLWHERLSKKLVRPHDDRGRPLPIRKDTSADAAVRLDGWAAYDCDQSCQVPDRDYGSWTGRCVPFEASEHSRDAYTAGQSGRRTRIFDFVGSWLESSEDR